MRRALSLLGLGALALTALAGLALTAAWLLLSTEAGRSLVVPRLVALANRELSGRIELDGFSAGAAGGIELRGLRLLDPRGRPVIGMGRARGQVDLSRLRSRRISLRLEVDGLALHLERDPGAPWNLEAALAPPRPPGRPEPESGPFPWTIRLARLSIRGGEIEVRQGGEPRLRARGLDLDARAILTPRGGRGEVQLAAELSVPVERPISLALAASMTGNRVLVPFLRAALGGAALELVAEGAPASRQGRAALLNLSLTGEEARLFAPRARPGNISARAYAESDGRIATAALEARPAEGGAGDAAAALRLPPAPLAAGIDLRIDALDPSRVAGFLPPGELRASASGHATGGADWRKVRGALRVSAAPSRLRGGRFGPAEMTARARDGAFEISRLEARMPGASLSGQGSWRPGGAVSGRLVADAVDLDAFARNLSALTGEKLPRLGGSGRIEASLAGSEREPRTRARLDAPRLQLESAAATGVAVEADLAGALDAPRLQLEVRAARLSAPGIEGRDLRAAGRLDGPDAEVRLSLVVPQAGAEPFSLRAAGRFSSGRRSLALSELGVAWPGTRFDLAAPARLDLSGPRVDRLELRSGSQRLAVEGGLAQGALDVRASAEVLELERIPPALLPAGLGLGGRLSFSGEARGRPAAPVAAARAELSGLSARGLAGIDASADLRLDGPARRAAGSLSLRGLAGATLDARADLPLDLLRARPGEPVSIRAEVAGLDVAQALRAAQVDLPLAGRLSFHAEVRGTAGAPAASGAATLDEGRWGEAAAGRVAASAELAGGPSSPRGKLEMALSDAEVAGWRELALQGTVTATGRSTGLEVLARAAGREVLSAQGEISLPPERLLDGEALRRAPLRLAVEARGVDLSRIPGPVELGGEVDLQARIAGRLTAPEAELSATGRGLVVAARPLGDLSVRGSARGRHLGAEASLRVAGGGRAEASLEAETEVSADAFGSESWRSAPARARFVAEGLDLTLFASLAPEVVRSASGRLEAHLEASGPLARLRPTGTLRVADGKVSVVGAGEWHAIELEAAMGEDDLRLARLAARRGAGTLQVAASVSGLRRAEPADLRGELRASAMAVSVYGQEMATLDLAAQLQGKVSAQALTAELTIPSGTALLPDRSLRTVQSLEPRDDVILPGRTRRPAPAAGPPYRVSLRLLLPGHFLVKRRDPRVDAELRGDVTFVVEGGQLTAAGRADLVRGSLDLYGNGRTFDLRRTSTTFGGGAISEGIVDGEAVAQFPDYLVKVVLGGKVGSPTVKLTSDPPLDEGRIAMLIATGRTEGRAGAGAAGTLTGEQAGYAVLGVFTTKLLRDALQNKLPVDSVALEPGQIRAGKYLSAKVYLDYVHRSSANPELGENANEVRVEYQVTQRWTLESRYGDANAGSASLLWSKDY